MYTVQKDYRNNDTLRKSFNELAEKTFGLNFEGWYQNGFWGENYNPYSIVIDGKVVSNVSVNKTDMLIDGEVKHFLQLGTVMTDEQYRNKGLTRIIMEQIGQDYEGKVDGFYLFANDSVLDYYLKFGFVKSKEYQYSRKVSQKGEMQLEKVVMDNPQAWKVLTDAMKNSILHGNCDMVDNAELTMFHVTGYLQESVYYHKDTDTYVIADIEEDSAFIYNVFSGKLTELDEVIQLFGEETHKVTLGFAPADAEKYEVKEFYEEDSSFFVKGDGMKVVEKEKLRIPTLAHA